jgi:hypothetical protein
MRYAFSGIALALVVVLPVCLGQTVTVSAVLNEANPNGSLCPGCRAVVVSSTNKIGVWVGNVKADKNYEAWSSRIGESRFQLNSHRDRAP